MTGPAEVAIAMAEWQRVVTAPRPRRTDLLRLAPGWPTRPVTVRVHRNHAFESVAALWGTFAAYSGLELQTTFGPYDDALTALGSTADLHVVSMDFERYDEHEAPQDLAAWLSGRAAAIAAGGAPVLVTDWPSNSLRAQAFNTALRVAGGRSPGVQIAAISELALAAQGAFHDQRTAVTAGTTWSGAAATEVSQCFGLRWIPGLLCRPVKAVVVDLDLTLYDGVLGEDGWRAVVLTPDHEALQRALLDLRKAGTLLAVVSRNDLADVEELMERRNDFPLRRQHFSALRATWGSKADAVRDIADELGFGVDSMAFLDDNVGELAEVKQRLPGIRTLHAADADSSRRAVQWCPGLHRTATTAEDRLRAHDADVAAERRALREHVRGEHEYLASLGAVLTVEGADGTGVARAAQLSARTNQFNTSVKRLTEADIASRLADGAQLALVSLRDRLSDSGVVASVIARSRGAVLQVDEVCISCRALGRGLESAIVDAALVSLTADGPGVAEIEYSYTTAPRNAPALEWLARRAGTDVSQVGTLRVPWDRSRAESFLASLPLTVLEVNKV